MAISRSYPTHLVKFRERKKAFYLSFFRIFKRNLFLCISLFTQLSGQLSAHPAIRSPGYLYACLMLLILPIQVIKLSKDDLFSAN